MAICLLSIPCVLCAGNVAASSWSATITAKGQDLGGVDTYEVVIGVGSGDKMLEAPPSPPEYSVKMEIISPRGPALTKCILQEEDGVYTWVIGVDPRGNMGPPGPGTAVLSWDALEFGGGRVELREGHDGSGRTVVNDMKSAASYEVQGEGTLYFTVVYTP